MLDVVCCRKVRTRRRRGFHSPSEDIREIVMIGSYHVRPSCKMAASHLARSCTPPFVYEQLTTQLVNFMLQLPFLSAGLGLSMDLCAVEQSRRPSCDAETRKAAPEALCDRQDEKIKQELT
jgi:hypothetical protein